MIRISIGRPVGLADEANILSYGITRCRLELQSALRPDGLGLMIRVVRDQQVAAGLCEYIASLVRATWAHLDVDRGVRPLDDIALVAAALAHSMSAGKAFVTADDVKIVAMPVLNHRLLLTSETRIRHQAPESILEDILATVPVPAGW